MCIDFIKLNRFVLFCFLCIFSGESTLRKTYAVLTTIIVMIIEAIYWAWRKTASHWVKLLYRIGSVWSDLVLVKAHCVTYWELWSVSRWPSIANRVGFTLPQLAQIDLSCVDVPLNTKQNLLRDCCHRNHEGCLLRDCCIWFAKVNMWMIVWKLFICLVF